MLVRSAARHDPSLADGLALGVLANVRGRGHGVHGRGRHDVVPPPTTGPALPHRTYSPLFTTATASSHHRAPAHRHLSVAPPEPGCDVATFTVARLRQDFVLGLMMTTTRRDRPTWTTRGTQCGRLFLIYIYRYFNFNFFLFRVVREYGGEGDVWKTREVIDFFF